MKMVSIDLIRKKYFKLPEDIVENGKRVVRRNTVVEVVDEYKDGSYLIEAPDGNFYEYRE